MVMTPFTNFCIFLAVLQRPKWLLPMAVFTLDKEHPLAKAGLRFVHVVEKVESGLKPGDVVFEFPYGRIVDTGMACRRERIIPPSVEIMTIHKEAVAARASCDNQGQDGKHINILPFRQAG
jgi:hypothetical protein